MAGASGAIGRQLTPRLIAAGYEVAGTTRTPSKAEHVQATGAKPVVMDALDREAVLAAVAAFRPDVIIHELTDLGGLAMRTFDRDFEVTNRLRTEGTRHLLEAGRAVGSRRFIAQSYAGWPLERSGSRLKTEDDPLDPQPARIMRAAFEAIAACERLVLDADWIEGIVLRYGSFYGPGTGLAADGNQLDLVRKRRWPLIGDSAGIWSFIHVADAADATVAAVEQGSRGIYHVVEDDPPAASEWLPAVASRIGAPPPMRVPRLVGRVLGGEAATIVMTEVRGAANDKAKRELAWQPRHAWRQHLGADEP